MNARLRRLSTRVAAHVVAIGLSAFGCAKLLGTMFTVPNVVWDTPMRELNGVLATWVYFGMSRELAVGLGVLQIFAAACLVVDRARSWGVLLSFSMLSAILVLDVVHHIVPGLYVAIALWALTLVVAAGEQRRWGAILRILNMRSIGRPPITGPAWAQVGSVAACIAIGGGMMLPFAVGNARAKTTIDGIWDVRGGSSASPTIDGWRTVYFELAPLCSVRIGRQLHACEFEEQDQLLTITFSEPDALGVRRIEAHLLEGAPTDVRQAVGTWQDVDGEWHPLQLSLIRQATPRGSRSWLTGDDA